MHLVWAPPDSPFLLDFHLVPVNVASSHRLSFPTFNLTKKSMVFRLLFYFLCEYLVCDRFLSTLSILSIFITIKFFFTQFRDATLHFFVLHTPGLDEYSLFIFLHSGVIDR